jgi:ribulose-phosphate 3-epimerase
MDKVSICPTVTAFDAHEYRRQVELLETFAERIHIDLMDGQFAPHVSPDLSQVWWPKNLIADLHLMYKKPGDYLDQLIRLKPNLVIIHFEAEVDHQDFVGRLHEHGIKAGLALLQDTTVDQAAELIPLFDDVMVFSGNLGEHGGTADESLQNKVRQIKAQFPGTEISWDGGINDQNAVPLVEAGVSVLNVGGFIQKAGNPEEAYAILKTLVEV